MDAFLTRPESNFARIPTKPDSTKFDSEQQFSNDELSTDVKLAILASLFPSICQETLLDLLISADGSVEDVSESLSGPRLSTMSPRKRSAASIGHQTSLAAFRKQETSEGVSPAAKRRTLMRKGQTLHLYTPEDIANHTPCSIVHNFLPPQQADDLLKELLEEAPTFERQTFKLFDNVVQSPHSACFYVESLEERERQKTEYTYNGSYLRDVRQITPQMRAVSTKVERTVNEDVAARIKFHYPGGKRLRYQSPEAWKPNAAFVNCYKGKLNHASIQIIFIQRFRRQRKRGIPLGSIDLSGTPSHYRQSESRRSPRIPSAQNRSSRR